MRQAGRITNWNDAKGFGFVTPQDGGARVFVHIKAFQASARRPVEGDLISYDTKPDAKGRLTAINVRFAGQRIQTPKAMPQRASRAHARPMRIPRLTIAVTFLLAMLAMAALGLLPVALAVLYLLMSVASFLMYALDKEVAGNARWRRTPESTLHLLDFLGGWPGGLIAQHVARHKTVKASFQRVFWISVLLNLVAFAALWRSGIAATLSAWLLG